MPYNYQRLLAPIENKEKKAFLSNVEIKKKTLKSPFEKKMFDNFDSKNLQR